jgi:putative endonuclease
MNATEYKGHFGEIFAILLLIIKGYKILDRRYKTVCGEIDIIARKRNVIVFVEVKSRKDMGKCYNAITQRQLNRIQRSSEIFLNQHHQLGKYFRRYDVILVANWRIPLHIENVSV